MIENFNERFFRQSIIEWNSLNVLLTLSWRRRLYNGLRHERVKWIRSEDFDELDGEITSLNLIGYQKT